MLCVQRTRAGPVGLMPPRDSRTCADRADDDDDDGDRAARGGHAPTFVR